MFWERSRYKIYLQLVSLRPLGPHQKFCQAARGLGELAIPTAEGIYGLKPWKTKVASE